MQSNAYYFGLKPGSACHRVDKNRTPWHALGASHVCLTPRVICKAIAGSSPTTPIPSIGSYPWFPDMLTCDPRVPLNTRVNGIAVSREIQTNLDAFEQSAPCMFASHLIFVVVEQWVRQRSAQQPSFFTQIQSNAQPLPSSNSGGVPLPCMAGQGQQYNHGVACGSPGGGPLGHSFLRQIHL